MVLEWHGAPDQALAESLVRKDVTSVPKYSPESTGQRHVATKRHVRNNKGRRSIDARPTMHQGPFPTAELLRYFLRQLAEVQDTVAGVVRRTDLVAFDVQLL